MPKRLIHFLKYNNSFTIGLMVFFLGSGVTLAANPELAGTVYSSSESVTSVDNRAIIAADLNNIDPHLRIKFVTEDTSNYYITYVYKTLLIQDAIWESAEVEKILTVSKKALAGADLGLYVAKELGDNMRYELSYLERVQSLEKGNGQSPKVVTVVYSGLIGKHLDPKTEVIEGYNPIVPAPVPESIQGPTQAATPVLVQNYEAPNSITPQTPVVTIPISSLPNQITESDIKRIIAQYLADHSKPAVEKAPDLPVITSQEVPEPESHQSREASTTPLETSDTSQTVVPPPDDLSTSTTTQSTSSE